MTDKPLTASERARRIMRELPLGVGIDEAEQFCAAQITEAEEAKEREHGINLDVCRRECYQRGFRAAKEKAAEIAEAEICECAIDSCACVQHVTNKIRAMEEDHG